MIQTSKPALEPSLPEPPKDEKQILSWLKDSLLVSLGNEFRDIRTSLRRITVANMSAALVTGITTPIGPGTEFSVTHNLGRIPVIYVANVDTTGSMIYKGATPWTSSLIYLKSNGISVGLTLLIL